MTAVADESPARPSALANFAAIMIRPRMTIRRILDAGRDRMIIPLVLLATLSALIGDLDRGAVDALRRIPSPHWSLIAIGICVGVTALFLLLFYFFSWIGFGLSRLLEGTATPREIRSAFAWGAVPIIWAILYRVPAALLMPGPTEARMRMGSGQFTLKPELMGMGCIGAVIFGALELGMLVWYAVVTSNTLAEANRFSTARGFGLLVLTCISPALVAIAAFLAS